MRRELNRDPSPPPSFVPEPPKVRPSPSFSPIKGDCQNTTLWSVNVPELQQLGGKSHTGAASPGASTASHFATLTHLSPYTTFYLIFKFLLVVFPPISGSHPDSDRLHAELRVVLQQHHQQRRHRWKQAVSPTGGREAHHRPSEPVVRRSEPREGGRGGPRQQVLPREGWTDLLI